MLLDGAHGQQRHGAPYVEAGKFLAPHGIALDSKGDIYLSAPDATDIGNAAAEDRAAIRRKLAEGLSVAWGEVQPRQYDFDGRVFRKPGGVAPQLEWNPDQKSMMAVVYLGLRPSIRIPLHPVADFSSDPWTE